LHQVWIKLTIYATLNKDKHYATPPRSFLIPSNRTIATEFARL
jgi:hypothetical protein